MVDPFLLSQHYMSIPPGRDLVVSIKGVEKTLITLKDLGQN